MHLHKNKILSKAVIVLLLAITGCMSSSATTVLKDPGRLIGRPRAEKNVVKILCLWEPSQGTGVDGKPCRGFAGQILFFGPTDKSAVRVHGDVRITEYEPYDPDDEEFPEPLHTFNFSADAWDVHSTEGSLGTSYSVFIPYMKKHRNAAHCGVKVEFLTEEGHAIASDITAIVLPAKMSSSTSALKRDVVKHLQATPASRTSKQPESTSDESENPLDTTTIRMKR